MHEAEAAYRRGYQQALCRAIDIIQLGAKLGDLTRWEAEVTEWRETYAGDATPPPEPVLPAGA